MHTQKRKVFFFSTLFFGVFLFYKTGIAFAQVVISEIGAYGGTNEEWVEIANIGTEPIDLTGYRFWESTGLEGNNHTLSTTTNSNFILLPNTYAVIVQQEEGFRRTHPNFLGQIFDSSWGSLNEGGEEIGLKDATGAFVERFTYVSAPNRSLERDTLSLANYTGTNWHEHASGDTAGQQNSERSETSEEGNPASETPAENETVPTTTSGGAPAPELLLSEFLSNPNTGESEWIEIENVGSAAVDLSRIRLKDGGSTIAVSTTTLEAHAFFVFTISGSRLNNDGDIIILETTDGTPIQTIAYGTWDDGDRANNVSAPARGQTLSYRNTVWQETLPTRGERNSETALTPRAEETPAPAPTPSAINSNTGTPPPISARAGDIVISEFVSDPTDGEVEFIELQNRSSQTIDITGWYIEEGSRAKTTLTGSIRPMQFFVIEKPKGGLNNSGDSITLFTKNIQEIDRVVYGVWSDGNTSDNADTPTDPTSAARIDGRDTGYDKDDFRTTSLITKGTQNRFPDQSAVANTNLPTPGASGIVINELYPNPPGADEEEFIELYHSGKTHVRLEGWGLRDESLRIFPFLDTVFYPGKYLLLPKKVTGISLNNTSDSLELLDPQKRVVERVSYTHVPEGESYVRNASNAFVWTTTITPEKENILTQKNRPPEISVEIPEDILVEKTYFFDASDTSDPEHDPLSYVWKFPNKESATTVTTTYTFTKTGTSTVTLLVKDNRGNEAKQSFSFFVQAQVSEGEEKTSETETSTHTETPRIILSELAPNPEGSDEAEFIELYNEEEQAADISGWTVTDGSGKKYRIPDQTIVLPEQYFLLQRKDTSIALNNSNDTITLKNAAEKTIDTVHYSGSKEGLVYIRTEKGAWVWSGTATPGKQNIFVQKNSFVSAGVGQFRSFTEAKELAKGSAVTVTGIAIVLPNTWSTQMFTIIEKDTGQTMPIFLSNKQFPPLALGDLVTVSGVMSEAQGVKRVNAKNKMSIAAKKRNERIQPKEISLADVGELDQIFVTVTGTVTDVSTKGFYLENEGEVFVKFRGELMKDPPDVAVGDRGKITGIVSIIEDEATLTPRTKTDIQILGEASEKLSEAVLEETPDVDPKKMATGAGVMTFLAAAFGRARMVMVLGSMKRTATRVILRKKPPLG